jgi:hypothetical protein
MILAIDIDESFGGNPFPGIEWRTKAEITGVDAASSLVAEPGFGQ